MEHAAELKHLQQRIGQCQGNIKLQQAAIKEAEDRIKHERTTMHKLEQELQQLKKQSEAIIVSEHAMLRYFERVLKFNLQEIREKILPPSLEEKVRTLGSGTYPANGHRVRVKGNVAITILTDDEQ